MENTYFSIYFNELRQYAHTPSSSGRMLTLHRHSIPREWRMKQCWNLNFSNHEVTAMNHFNHFTLLLFIINNQESANLKVRSKLSGFTRTMKKTKQKKQHNNKQINKQTNTQIFHPYIFHNSSDCIFERGWSYELFLQLLKRTQHVLRRMGKRLVQFNQLG